MDNRVAVCYINHMGGTRSPALSQQGYAFPPFSLIGRCLQKIHQERATVVLIAPVWSSQTWYPWLFEMLTHCPVLLLSHMTLLQDPFNRVHPLLVKGQLQLAAWRVSSMPTHSQEFRKELQRLSQQAGERAPTLPTSWVGSRGLAGVIKGVLIPFHAMSNISWTF